MQAAWRQMKMKPRKKRSEFLKLADAFDKIGKRVAKIKFKQKDVDALNDFVARSPLRRLASTPHNPDGVTPEQLNPPVVPWRLMDEDEIVSREHTTHEIQGWEKLNKKWSDVLLFGSFKATTYRTRLTRAQLAKLTKGGGK